MSAITSITAKLRAISPELEGVVAVLEVIQGATQLGGAPAATALDVVAAALRSLNDQAAGTITHEQLVEHLAQVRAELVGDRSAEDAELAAIPPR